MIKYLNDQLNDARVLIVVSIIVWALFTWTGIEVLVLTGSSVLTIAVTQYATLRKTLRAAKEVAD